MHVAVACTKRMEEERIDELRRHVIDEMMVKVAETQVSKTSENALAGEDNAATGVGTDPPLINTQCISRKSDPDSRSASNCCSPPLRHTESIFGPQLGYSNPTQEIEEKTADDSGMEPSCLGGVNLPSRHLASILTFLDAAHVQWPTNSFTDSDASGADATTTVTSNLSGVNSADRCANSIISSDGTLIHPDTTDFKHPSYEIKKLRQDLEAVTRERDLLREREIQHAESLNILKQEINSLTLAKISSPSSFSTELEQLRLENELFAAQIVENEVEIREIRTVLECLDTENSQMRNDLEAVRGKMNEEKAGTKAKADPESSVEARSLKDQIKDLASRLTDVERARGVLEASIEKETLLRSEEINAITSVVCETKEAVERALRSQARAADSSCEGFEVTMEGNVSDVNRSHEEEPCKALEVSGCDGARMPGACDCCQFMTRDG
jgi:hypothetical protein